MKKLFVIVFLFVVSIMTSQFSFAQQTWSLEILPTDDAYVVLDVTDPNSKLNALKFGDKTFLKLWSVFHIPGTEDKEVLSYAYLKFNIPEITGEISSAKLRMYTYVVQIASDSKDVELHLANSQWSESTLTGFDAPSFENQRIAVATVTDQNSWYEWDITDTIKENTNSSISLVAIFADFQNNNEEVISFASKDAENSELRPVLIIKQSLESTTQDSKPQPEQNINSKLQIPENSIQLYPVDDSYVSYDSSDPSNQQQIRNLGFGDKEFLKLWYIFHTPEHQQSQFMTHSYLGFDLSTISQDDIGSAKLYMFANYVDLAFDSIDIGIYVSDPDWSESTLTALTAPAFDDESIGITTVDVTDKWYSWDITEIAKEKTGSKLSLAVIFSEIIDENEEIVQFVSKDAKNQDTWPVLIIEKSSSIETSTELLLIPVIIAAVIIGLIIKKKKKNQKIPA